MEVLTQREATEKKLQRVAVVFVHGQGEQTPMTDAAELARAVWVTDPAFGGGDKPIWSVPIYDADLSEQRRLVTAKTKGLKVDFYQFYWADLMRGNTLWHVMNWFHGLLKRRDETPSHLMDVRRLVMAIGAGIGLFGLAYGLVTVARFLNVDVWSWGNFYAALMTFGCAVAVWFLADPAKRTSAMLVGLGLIVASLLLGLTAVDMIDGNCGVVDVLQTSPGPGCDGPLFPADFYSKVVTFHGFMAAVTFVGLLAGLYGLRRLSASFLTPVMADSARLFTPSPENIPNRDRIRKRGMELLEALHQSERRYDRIIVVAHSLGTVVAYNVLSQYWGNVYQLFSHAASASERNEVAAKAQALSAGGGKSAVFAYRRAVRAYFQALNSVRSALPQRDVNWRTAAFASTTELLRRQLHGDVNQPATGAKGIEPYRSPWRVSDFITLGSPLSYGSFLLSESEAAFEQEKRTRRFPTNPPAMDGGTPPHHAGLFSATIWTNVHFATSGLIRGDVVGGAVAPKFGPGVLDVCVDPGPGLPAFAHNEYWKLTEGSTDPADHKHTLALRAALNLAGSRSGGMNDGDDLLAGMIGEEAFKKEVTAAF